MNIVTNLRTPSTSGGESCIGATFQNEFQGHIVSKTFIIPKHDQSLQNHEEALQNQGRSLLSAMQRCQWCPL